MLPKKIFIEKSQWQKGGDGVTTVPFLRFYVGRRNGKSRRRDTVPERALSVVELVQNEGMRWQRKG